MARTRSYRSRTATGFRNLTLLLLLALPFHIEQAQSQTIAPEQATGFIAALGDRAITILSDPALPMSRKETAFHGLVSDAFQMDFIARFAMGKHWRKASPTQQREYVHLFRQYIVKTYGQHLASYSGETFKVQGSKPVGQKDTIVRSRIVRPGGGQPITADWRLRQFPKGPQIIDVMIEGVSMGVTQRQEFSAVISRNGIDGLIETLRARGQTLTVAAPQD